MKMKGLPAKKMTVKKRLVISNVLMILVPVIITALIGLICVSVIWISVKYGTGLGFKDSEDFYKASQGISALVENAIEKGTGESLSENLSGISGMLDKNSMALSVDSSGANLYQYGQSTDADETLSRAVESMGGQGFVSNGNRELYVRQVDIKGVAYRVSIFSVSSSLSFGSLKTALVISAIVLTLAIIISIFLTNRFLIRFVFQNIEQPLEILSSGVRQISEGNLEYRIDYNGEDEFAPICDDFNEMAARLKASEERTRQHEQSRKELLVGISHDLRSPLTSIRAYVEGLLDGVAKTPEAQKGYLEIVKNKAEDIDRMLAKIFLFSKMELGEYPNNPERLRLDDEIRQLIRAIGAEYEERGLILSVDELVPATVSVDPDQLRRVLTNIMENSVKYKTKDIGTLKISLREENGKYCLSLSDDGPGVPDEALPRLFEVFYRSDPSRQNPRGGSGLGLAIAANAVQRMNGSIEAEAGETGGLRIVICLPKAEE